MELCCLGRFAGCCCFGETSALLSLDAFGKLQKHNHRKVTGMAYVLYICTPEIQACQT